MSDPAIGPENIIDKLWFVRYGAEIKGTKETLKQELYAFLRSKRVKNVKRQAIKHWFDTRKSIPKRTQAIRFLRDYFTETIHRNELEAAAQKQVFDQIKAFFRRTEWSEGGVTEKDGSVSLSQSRRVMIDVAQSNAISRIASNTLCGVYRLLHMQLDDNLEIPVVSEVLEVFQRGKELRFKLFHVPGEPHRSIISGVVVVIGRMIWFVGSSTTEIPRMRVLGLRFIETAENRYSALRWGIMMTEMPKPSSSDPIACRFILLRDQDEAVNVVQYAEKHVRDISKAEIEEEPLKSLMRVIRNNVTALSDGHSSDPLSKAGTPIVDEPLKVNQVTIELVADKLADQSRVLTISSP